MAVEGSVWEISPVQMSELESLVCGGLSVRAAAGRVGVHYGRALALAHARKWPVSTKRHCTGDERAAIRAALASGMEPMDVARAVGVSSSVVYRVGMVAGLWVRHSDGITRKSTTRRCEYLLLRARSMDRRGAAKAVGISVETALDWDKGVTKRNGQPRSAFIPAGPDVGLYNRLMSVLECVPGRQAVPVEIVPVERVEKVISSRYLSVLEREKIADLRRAGKGIREIAREVGRSPGTVSREIARNSSNDGRYEPHQAHRRSVLRRFRPKVSKIAANPALAAFIQERLSLRHSPEQIAGALRRQFPDDQAMWVCVETIYQALYLQSRGGLKRQIQAALRTGRARRIPRKRPDQRRSRFVDEMVMISERPAEVEDRAVPGHWEGDLILGAGNASAIGTLVERSTRYVMLVHLPDGHTAEAVRDQLVKVISTLPEHLRGSLTWDQGCEMAGHKSFSIATGCPVYFCDPASPWQRGSNENTNGLLRQYFPKGTDLSVFGPEDLEHVAQELNARPRKTLNFETPAERMRDLLAST